MEGCIRLQRADDDGVFVLKLNNGSENRFTASLFQELSDALDTVESNEGPTALLITGHGTKFFSNGFDLTWLTGPDGAAALEVYPFGLARSPHRHRH